VQYYNIRKANIIKMTEHKDRKNKKIQHFLPAREPAANFKIKGESDLTPEKDK
jgi:hypothetical protein